MGLSDWTEQKDGANQYQDNTHAYEGSYSWYLPIDGDSNNINQIITLDQSGSDAPVEAAIRSKYYGTNLNNNGPDTKAFVFRYQDNNNYYLPVFAIDNSAVVLNKYVGGAHTKVDSQGAPLSANQWGEMYIEIYVDSAGVLNVRYEIDADDDGNLEDMITLTDSANDLSSGGAVGLGSNRENQTYNINGDMWFDKTEVYY
jgi:hypothetical protein